MRRDGEVISGRAFTLPQPPTRRAVPHLRGNVQAIVELELDKTCQTRTPSLNIELIMFKDLGVKLTNRDLLTIAERAYPFGRKRFLAVKRALGWIIRNAYPEIYQITKAHAEQLA